MIAKYPYHPDWFDGELKLSFFAEVKKRKVNQCNCDLQPLELWPQVPEHIKPDVIKAAREFQKQTGQEPNLVGSYVHGTYYDQTTKDLKVNGKSWMHCIKVFIWKMQADGTCLKDRTKSDIDIAPPDSNHYGLKVPLLKHL